MVKTLTRSELYTLIWSKPRTTLAKELGVSDVAIGKHCAREHIPGPPPGYWARVGAGKTTLRPRLPERLPGQRGAIAIGIDDRRYWRAQENLDEELVAQTFVEVAELQVADAMKRLGRVTACRDLSDPDNGLKKILAAEARRRARHEEDDWSFYEPYYDAPHHQRQLRILGGLALAFGRLHGRQEVSRHDEWIQGTGTVHQLMLRLDFGGSSLLLEFLEPGQVTRARKSKAVEVTTLRTGGDATLLPAHDWVDAPGAKLESQLEAIAKTLLERAEATLRLAAQREYDRRVERRTTNVERRTSNVERRTSNVERRKEMRAEIELRKLEAEKARLVAIAAHREKVRPEILELSARYRKAIGIRAMVAVLGEHPDVGADDKEVFEMWRRQAMEVADLLDPMKKPFSNQFRRSREYDRGEIRPILFGRTQCGESRLRILLPERPKRHKHGEEGLPRPRLMDANGHKDGIASPDEFLNVETKLVDAER